MVNKIRERTVTVLVVCTISGFANFSYAAAVTLSNATTSLTVNGGEANNGLIPLNGFFRYTDLAAAEETTWSIDPLLVFSDSSTLIMSNGATGGFGSPTDLGNGVVRSTASVPANISVQADVELVGSNARTTFSFTDDSGNGLDGTTFVFYAENDLFSASDDLAAFTGSIAGGDLSLFMFDSVAQSLTVKMTSEANAGATLSLFGAGLWTAWGTALEAGNLSVLSSNGSNFVTSGDLGLAFAFTLTGASAEVVVNYDTQPMPPIPVPAGAWLLLSGIIAFSPFRRSQSRGNGNT